MDYPRAVHVAPRAINMGSPPGLLSKGGSSRLTTAGECSLEDAYFLSPYYRQMCASICGYVDGQPGLKGAGVIVTASDNFKTVARPVVMDRNYSIVYIHVVAKGWWGRNKDWIWPAAGVVLGLALTPFTGGMSLLGVLGAIGTGASAVDLGIEAFSSTSSDKGAIENDPYVRTAKQITKWTGATVGLIGGVASLREIFGAYSAYKSFGAIRESSPTEIRKGATDAAKELKELVREKIRELKDAGRLENRYMSNAHVGDVQKAFRNEAISGAIDTLQKPGEIHDVASVALDATACGDALEARLDVFGSSKVFKDFFGDITPSFECKINLVLDNSINYAVV